VASSGKRSPRLAIVSGLPGSGKTTHAKRLEHELGAIRFSADEWMDALGMNLWESEPRARIEKLQWKLARELLALGTNVVVEWGTWARAERDALRTEARALGAAVELHYLDAPAEILLERVRLRNREAPPVTLEDLRKWSELIERPSAEEMALFDPPLE